MKPWFVKEADIIKFPEPEKKVIELPNVQSYPDFLTGVKDLHNRKAKGEISQDSHDRLYQDLIHRFMKKESFETPWFLREDAILNEGIFDVVKKIYNLAKINGPIIIKQVIDYVKSRAKQQPASANQVQQPTPNNQVQQPQVQENAVADQQTLMGIATRSPELIMDAYRALVSNLQKPITNAIQKFSTKYNLPTKLFSHLIQDVNLQKHSAESIVKAIEWLNSGPLTPAEFTKAQSQSINILEELSTKDQKLTSILAEDNLLFDLARLKELGGRGEGLMQMLFTGGISGGQEGAKGDVKIVDGEYEVKANGRKSDGSASPVVFTGRAKDTKEKLIKAGSFIKDYITNKTGKKDHLSANGKSMRADRGATKQGGKDAGKVSFNSYRMKGMTDFIDTLNKADATEFLTTPLEIMFDEVPTKAKKYINKSVATRPFMPAVYNKAFLIANANHYLSQKKFDGIIFLDITKGTQAEMLMRVFKKDDIVKQVEAGNIYRNRTESINSMLSGDSQSALPGLGAK